MDLIGNDISLDDIKSVPDDCDFALESILAEYGDYGTQVSKSPPMEQEEPSRPIVLGDDEGILTTQLRSEDEEKPHASSAVHIETTAVAQPEIQPESEPDDQEDSDVRIYHIESAAAKADISKKAAPPSAESDEGVTEQDDAQDTEAHINPPLADFPGASSDEDEGVIGSAWNASAEDARGRSFGEVLAAPFVSILALFALRKQQQSGAAAETVEEEEDLGPEMDAESASKYYAGNVKSFRLRLRIAILLSAVLVWIAFGLPVAGMLKTSPAALSLLCLILELTVVMLGLDIFTAGLMSLIRLKPSLWSLVSIACFAAALDAAVTTAMGGTIEGLPFCAVAAVSMTFALSGALQTCRGYRLSLKALVLSKTPYTVTSEPGVSDDGMTILKSKRVTAGYLRRCEEPDCTETAYGAVAAFLLAAALILSVLAAAISKEWTYFFRILAAITAPCAPFAAFCAFPLPYSIISRRLFQSGSALAGWAGLRDIGSSRHLIITDGDIFPPGTISIESVRILEGTWPEKVISFAGSVICASGSGLAPVFTEMMRRNNCSMQRVEEFCCHEGGGLTAIINGEEILCGNAGFMHLMGIRLPQKLASKSSVFVSISGVLTGVFTIKYTPVTSVQDALASLLHTRRDPIFAIRDFNITPLMIRKKFRMPTDGFDFPTFAKRYEISAAEPSADSHVSAIISREGLGPLVELSELGRKLYIAVKLSAIMSLLCTFIGIVLMFTLCLSGSFDSATAGNVLTYMFLWLVPIIVLTLGLGR